MKVFSNFFKKESINIDPRITRALFTSVESVIHGAALSLTSIGRTNGSYNNKIEKHSIKRVDRLLGNKTLHASRNEFYQIIINQFVTTNNPIIVVDWSSVYDSNFVMIRASIPVSGRAITIYEEIYPESELTSQKAHKKFLANLDRLLPINCRPIICTDAGFRVTWLKMVDKYDWYWVGRVRGLIHCQLEGEDKWRHVDTLHSRASTKASELPSCMLSKTHKYTCRAVVYKKKSRGRRNLNNKGIVTKDNINQKQAKSAKDPWFLISNLSEVEFPAHKLVAIYQRRMTIEETFRDNKNEYYGLGLSRSRSKSISRLETILLIAMLAQFALYVIGKAAELNGYHRQFQANTLQRRVLSYGYLALRLLQHKGRKYRLTRSELRLALEGLVNET